MLRNKLIYEGGDLLEYEIRNIVKKAEQVASLGKTIYWENIGDPIQKNAKIPTWMKEIIGDLLKEDDTYGYCHSKGILETRKFLANHNNRLGGVQIDAGDILFFNGLGDAISKVYQFMHASARIIGPSPAYSTHSSAEASHSNSAPLTYRLDPDNRWLPDMDHLYNQVKFNPSIVGILIINPDNPTGMVYPESILSRIVDIAEEFGLILISDEVYTNITYHGVKSIALSQVLRKTGGIALKGISKEIPWPGSRCGWMEFYNRDFDLEFNHLCQMLEDSKMVEVCSTTLPQKAIPRIFSHPEYVEYRKNLNVEIGKRGDVIAEYLEGIEYITFNRTFGAFYNTIVFRPGALQKGQSLTSEDSEINKLLKSWDIENMPLDKQFAYYLLAVEGVCVVPLSSFHSDLLGFRVTLLEEDTEILHRTFSKIRDGIIRYCKSKPA